MNLIYRNLLIFALCLWGSFSYSKNIKNGDLPKGLKYSITPELLSVLNNWTLKGLDSSFNNFRHTSQKSVEEYEGTWLAIGTARFGSDSKFHGPTYGLSSSADDESSMLPDLFQIKIGKDSRKSKEVFQIWARKESCLKTNQPNEPCKINTQNLKLISSLTLNLINVEDRSQQGIESFQTPLFTAFNKSDDELFSEFPKDAFAGADYHEYRANHKWGAKYQCVKFRHEEQNFLLCRYTIGTVKTFEKGKLDWTKYSEVELEGGFRYTYWLLTDGLHEVVHSEVFPDFKTQN